MGFRMFNRFLTLLTVAMLLVLAVQAQVETGQITGTVTDQSGAVIPNANITAKNVATGVTRTTATTNAGVYVLPNIPAGTYEVSIAAQGFATVKRELAVNVGAKVGADAQLKVGNTSTTVEVAATAVQVNTESQTIGSTITNQAVAELPSANRDVYALVATLPNVAPDSNDGRGVGYAINGMRSASTNVLLDGVANNDEFSGSTGQDVPMDAVQEYSVLTSNYTAEVGRASGGVVNVVTKSGTNEFHGSLYEFNRVSALGSNSFYNNANELSKGVYARNSFGYSIGGPIQKNKLFFFQNTEWLKVRSSQTHINMVPTAQFIGLTNANTQAFFSAYGKVRPDATTLATYTKDQLTAAGSNPCTGGSATTGCALIPGSTPMFTQVKYKTPSDAGGGDPRDQYLIVGNVDWNKSEKTQFSFKYALQNVQYPEGTNAYSAYKGYDTGYFNKNNHVTVSMTRSFSPTFVSQTRLSFNRLTNVQPLGDNPAGPTLYMSSSAQTLLGYSVTLPGYLPWNPGSAIPFGGPQNFFTLAEDLSKVWGKHNIRFGGQIQKMQDNRTFGAYQEAVETLGSNRGNAFDNMIAGVLRQFNAAVDPQGKYPCAPATPGGVAVVNAACTVNLPVSQPNFSRSNLYNEFALYIQDTWKVTRTVSLNLGMRYEYFGTQHNKNPKLDSNFYLGTGAGIMDQVVSGSVQQAPNSPIGKLWKSGSKNFAPRLGIAWDVRGDGKTSVRAGWGIGYERNFGNVTFNAIQNPPAYAVLGLTAADVGGYLPITVSNMGPLAGNTGSKALPAVTLRPIDPNIKQAYAHQFSAALEHQVSPNILASLTYSGSAGRNLYAISSFNKPGSGFIYKGYTSAATPEYSRLTTQYGNINWRGNGGSSNYNAFIPRLLLKNVGRTGLTLDFSYTWAHALDNLSSTFTSGTAGNYSLGFMDPLHPNLDRGSADFDIRHRGVISGTWALPFLKGNRPLDKVLGGWELAPILTMQTGNPVTLYDCYNSYTYCSRATMLGAVPAGVTSVATSTPDVYTFLPVTSKVFELGNAAWYNPKVGLNDFGPYPANMIGRNTVKTPGDWNLTLGAYKNTSISERVKLQLRLEMYNAFNHANFYVDGTTLDVSSSDVQGYYDGKRNIQLGIKLTF
jgi:hypothetical protein